MHHQVLHKLVEFVFQHDLMLQRPSSASVETMLIIKFAYLMKYYSTEC